MKMKLKDLARAVGADVSGDADRTVSGAAPFERAGSEDITFAESSSMLKRIQDSRAGAVIVSKRYDGEPPVDLLLADHPRLAFAKAMALLYPPHRPEAGIHPSAVIGDDVIVGKDVYIGPHAVIGRRVRLEDRVVIHPHVVIEAGVTIGADTVIHPHVTLYEGCRIGRRVIINAGSVVGSDGFGFVPEGEKQVRIPHIGTVEIEDDVEIGALNTIDRATFGRTRIRSGVKTDNHVQIAHNVEVGENTIIVAQVGIAGSARIGRNVVLAGQAGISGHITIGDAATVGPQAGVARPVADGQMVSGTPEMPHRLWLRVQQVVPKLPELKKRLDELDKRLEMLEGHHK